LTVRLFENTSIEKSFYVALIFFFADRRSFRPLSGLINVTAMRYM